MENNELIPALRLDAEWAHSNEWETPIMLGDHLDTAADALAALLAVTAERDALKKALDLMAEDFYDSSDDEIHAGFEGLVSDYIRMAQASKGAGKEQNDGKTD